MVSIEDIASLPEPITDNEVFDRFGKACTDTDVPLLFCNVENGSVATFMLAPGEDLRLSERYKNNPDQFDSEWGLYVATVVFLDKWPKQKDEVTEIRVVWPISMTIKGTTEEIGLILERKFGLPH